MTQPKPPPTPASTNSKPKGSAIRIQPAIPYQLQRKRPNSAPRSGPVPTAASPATTPASAPPKKAEMASIRFASMSMSMAMADEAMTIMTTMPTMPPTPPMTPMSPTVCSLTCHCPSDQCILSSHAPTQSSSGRCASPAPAAAATSPAATSPSALPEPARPTTATKASLLHWKRRMSFDVRATTDESPFLSPQPPPEQDYFLEPPPPQPRRLSIVDKCPPFICSTPQRASPASPSSSSSSSSMNAAATSFNPTATGSNTPAQRPYHRNRREECVYQLQNGCLTVFVGRAARHHFSQEELDGMDGSISLGSPVALKTTIMAKRSMGTGEAGKME